MESWGPERLGGLQEDTGWEGDEAGVHLSMAFGCDGNRERGMRGEKGMIS